MHQFSSQAEYCPEFVVENKKKSWGENEQIRQWENLLLTQHTQYWYPCTHYHANLYSQIHKFCYLCYPCHPCNKKNCNLQLSSSETRLQSEMSSSSSTLMEVIIRRSVLKKIISILPHHRHHSRPGDNWSFLEGLWEGHLQSAMQKNWQLGNCRHSDPATTFTEK